MDIHSVQPGYMSIIFFKASSNLKTGLKMFFMITLKSSFID